MRIRLTDDDILNIGEYMIETKCTVRDISKKYNLASSSVHRYLTTDLKRISYSTYCEVRNVLDKNRSERHLRGGDSTRRKFITMRIERYKEIQRSVR